jgi:uroporphyrinogen-III synthase
MARDLAARVVRLRERPRVLVTRPAEGAAETLAALLQAGMDPVTVPTIEIRDEPPGGALDAAVAEAAASGAWVVPTSPNGVRVALEALERIGIAAIGVRWAVVGRGSAALLQPLGIEPFVPSRPVGAALAAELPLGDAARVVLVRSDIADRGLVTSLSERGATVVDVVGYRTHEGPASSVPVLAAALEEPLDAIAFASGSAVRGLLALAAPGTEQRLLKTPAICIGPSSAAVARATGFTTVVEAADTSPAALVAAVAATLAATLPPVPVDAEAAADLAGPTNVSSIAPGGSA